MRPKPQATPHDENRYRCKWKDCQTYLHNLETLRKHVLKVHRPNVEELSQGGVGYVCRFATCKYIEDYDDGGSATTRTFLTHEEWTDHIQNEHIYRIAMKYGDGPSTKAIGFIQLARDKQRYLSDQSGRTTTPNVSDQDNMDLREDTLNLTEIWSGKAKTIKEEAKEEADIMARESFFKAHGVAKDLKKQSEEVIRAMAMRKEKIGPGIDRGGCTLINEQRRATFVSNPGIRRIVDEDY